MSKYFAKFPSTLYTLSTSTETPQAEAVTDITKRLGINLSSVNNNMVFVNYEIREGDTPELIAHKYYGDVEKHWIVLMSNAIVDPQWQWPLDDRTLSKFVENKYVQYANTSIGQTGYEWALQNVESYYRAETKTSSANKLAITSYYQIDKGTYDSLNATTESYDVTLDDGTTVSVKVEKLTRTYYQYEQKINEDKRQIKLLDKVHVPTLMNEFKTVFSTQ